MFRIIFAVVLAWFSTSTASVAAPSMRTLDQSVEIHVAGRYRPLHFSRGDDYEAVARAWLEENPKAANGACAKDASDCIVETRTTDAPDSFCADKYRDCMVAALAQELRERVAAS